MRKQPFLSVVIPALNEEKRISRTLLAVDHYLAKQNYDCEIVVVNDGSKDKTADLIRSFQKIIKNLYLIDNKVNKGKGGVIRQGMLEAKGKIRLFMDADNSTTIEHVEKMWPYFEQGYKVVIGTRDKRDAKGATQAVPQPFLKRLLGNMGNLLIQIFAVPGIWDTQCGFKGFTARAAQNIFSKCLIDRWGFDIETLALVKRLNYKIAIIPVNWINDPESRVSLKGYLRTFRELFQIWWWLVTNKYGLRGKKAKKK